MSAAEQFKKAVAFHQKGDLKGASKFYQEALKRDDKHVSSLYNLGLVLQDSGDEDGAINCYNQVISIKPEYANVYNSIGLLQEQKGQLDEALVNLQKAVDLKPDSVFYTNLAGVYIALRKSQKAALALELAVKHNDKNAVAHFKLGNIFHENGMLERAIKHYKKACDVAPRMLGVWRHLGKALGEQGHLDEAYEALDNDSTDPKTLAVKFKLKQEYCDWSGFEELKSLVINNDEVGIIGPFEYLSICNDPEKNMLVAMEQSQKIYNRLGNIPTFDFSNRNKKEKIRIGYVSADFREHPVGHTTKYLYGSHDKSKFEIFGYSLCADDQSECRHVIQSGCDKFFDLTDLSDIEAAQKIYDDEIDILVDLAGHTRGGRIEIAAMRPAPVQVNFNGFPGTSGSNWLDYIITDRFATPEAHDEFYTESLVIMSDSSLVNHDREVISEKQMKKSDFGLPDDAFVFSAHCPTYKLEPVIFDVWMELLREVPRSVLWLRESSKISMANIKQEAAARGVSEDRICFAGKIADRAEYFKRISLADLCLDTMVYNGGTTTMDALWVGLPVITLPGGHYISRISASILNGLGMNELIAQNMNEYKALAIDLASCPEKLQKTRGKLWKNRMEYSFFDCDAYARKLEKAYVYMWKNHVFSKKPQKSEVLG